MFLRAELSTLSIFPRKFLAEMSRKIIFSKENAEWLQTFLPTIIINKQRTDPSDFS